MTGSHILHGGKGHDGAKDGVGGEEDELAVGLEAVVDLVAQGGVVPGGGRDRKYGKTKELHISCTTSAPVKVPPLVLSLTLMYFYSE